MRQEAIEAMALNLHFAHEGEESASRYRSDAAAALDALLDFLTAHADEWWYGWYQSEGAIMPTALTVPHLIQALGVLR